MAATALLKKLPSMKKWIAQADPKETRTVKKLNGRWLLFSSIKMTHYFKASVRYFLSNFYFFIKW